tara:strand:- start:1988 stop:2392 length:405 start_codon:yes stop_codon:yes gene_type:complete
MNKKTIFTNGCFDILHRGHLELFKHAKSLGHTLIVGIDSDEKVKLDKGSDRPYNNIEDRVEMLKSIKFIDKVFVFYNTKDLEELIKNISPDILIIGSDWRGKKVVGQQYAKELNFFERINGYSTTNILQNTIGR